MDGKAGGRTDRWSDRPSYSDERTHWTSPDGQLDVSLMDQYMATMLKLPFLAVFFSMETDGRTYGDTDIQKRM